MPKANLETIQIVSKKLEKLILNYYIKSKN